MFLQERRKSILVDRRSSVEETVPRFPEKEVLHTGLEGRLKWTRVTFNQPFYCYKMTSTK